MLTKKEKASMEYLRLSACCVFNQCGKGFVKVAHIMEISFAEIHERLPNHLRNWMSDLLNENDVDSLL